MNLISLVLSECKNVGLNFKYTIVQYTLYIKRLYVILLYSAQYQIFLV